MRQARRQMYCDTSLICDALESAFPAPRWRSVYPRAADGRAYAPLMRGFASYWTDVRAFVRFLSLPSAVPAASRQPLILSHGPPSR